MKYIPALSLALAALLFSSCEDAPPSDYVPRPFVQGYLLVDEPIRDIVVAWSQPIDQPYDYRSSLVRDAEVSISFNGTSVPLVFREGPDGSGYHSADSSLRVLPETTYHLSVRMPDGSTVRAETTTPQTIAWVRAPSARLLYPIDTTRLLPSDSLRALWTGGDNTEFLLRVMVLDTVGYGQYLTPPTAEANARTGGSSGGPGSGGGGPGSGKGGSTSVDYSVTHWSFVAQNRFQIPWTSFTWFGRHEVTVFAADRWFLSWFKSVQFSRLSPEYDDEESNIEGGLGVFGSASVIRKEVLLLKH